MLNGTFWPAAMVTGSDNPPTLKTELFVVAPVTVTLAPVAVRLPDAVALEPSTTLPNGRVPGLTDNCPTVVVPVPEIGIVKLGLDASELTVRLPFAVPEVVGANLTLKVALCPAASVSGAATPLNVNPVPLIPICETLTADPPLLISVVGMD